jgi:hypothetical protein
MTPGKRQKRYIYKNYLGLQFFLSPIFLYQFISQKSLKNLKTPNTQEAECLDRQYEANMDYTARSSQYLLPLQKRSLKTDYFWVNKITRIFYFYFIHIYIFQFLMTSLQEIILLISKKFTKNALNNTLHT